MKFSRIVLAALAVIAVSAVPLARAALLEGGEEYFLRADEVVRDDLYAGGGNVSLAGRVEGDAMLGGGNVSVLGPVANDLFAGGGSLVLAGDVSDDLRAAGGNILLSGAVGDDLVAAGGQLHLVSGAVVGGDAVMAGGRIVLDGRVAGNAVLAGGEVVVSGEVLGTMRIKAEKIVFTERAIVRGALTYESSREAEVAEGAQLLGGVEYKPWVREAVEVEARGVLKAILAAFAVVKLLMMLTLALVLTLVFTRVSAAVAKRGVHGFWGEVLRGFVMLVVIPVAAVVLMVTVLGVPLGALLFLSYAAMLMLASAYAGVIFGKWLEKIVFKQPDRDPTWSTALLGVVALALVALVPVIGWIACSLFFLSALGSLGKQWQEVFWKER